MQIVPKRGKVASSEASNFGTNSLKCILRKKNTLVPASLEGAIEIEELFPNVSNDLLSHGVFEKSDIGFKEKGGGAATPQVERNGDWEMIQNGSVMI